MRGSLHAASRNDVAMNGPLDRERRAETDGLDAHALVVYRGSGDHPYSLHSEARARRSASNGALSGRSVSDEGLQDGDCPLRREAFFQERDRVERDLAHRLRDHLLDKDGRAANRAAGVQREAGMFARCA